jgi:hypothetical protein
MTNHYQLEGKPMDTNYIILNSHRNQHHMYAGHTGSMSNLVAYINCNDHGQWYAQRAHGEGFKAVLDGPAVYMSRTDVMNKDKVADALGIG